MFRKIWKFRSYLFAGVSVAVLAFIWLEYPQVEQSVVFHTESRLLQDAGLPYWNQSGYLCSQPNFTNIEQSHYRLPREVQESKFTVVVLTHQRTEIMFRTVQHYAQMKKVDRVIVLWNNEGMPAPNIQEALRTSTSIIVKVLPENKLRLRYQPLPEAKTQALFNVDDDMLVDEEDVNRAFAVWQLNPYTVAGFFPRSYTQPLIGWSKYHYKMGKRNGAKYSIVLPDVAFIHREYFRLYTEILPSGMADLIDGFNNCEDISMSFLVSSLCQCVSGLHVEPRTEIIHLSGRQGLSGSSNHGRERGICISVFSTFFEKMPLRETNCIYA